MRKGDFQAIGQEIARPGTLIPYYGVLSFVVIIILVIILAIMPEFYLSGIGALPGVLGWLIIIIFLLANSIWWLAYLSYKSKPALYQIHFEDNRDEDSSGQLQLHYSKIKSHKGDVNLFGGHKSRLLVKDIECYPSKGISRISPATPVPISISQTIASLQIDGRKERFSLCLGFSSADDMKKIYQQLDGKGQA